MKMKKLVSHIFFLTTFGIIFSACTPNLGSSSLRGSNTNTQNISGANLGIGQGYVLADTPLDITGNYLLDPNTDLNSLLTPATITNNGFLTGGASPCSGALPCFDVLANQTSLSALQSADGKWAYNYNTPEFLQVNTFFHMTKILDQFFINLSNSRTLSTQYDSAIPLNIFFRTIPLHAYADCNFADNANFDPSKFSLCFGYLTGNKNIKFAQDNTIIYHEVGHYLQNLQFNLRNAAAVIKPEINYGFYSESGSIGEGLSDFYSYYVNGRPRIGEWATGRTLNASRPISESDNLHASGISTDPAQRLSYPQFLNYDPNNAQIPIEDIHYSGMIISHYLVALSEDFITTCGMTKPAATAKVIHLLSETLAEIGDMSSTATNAGGLGKINLNAVDSKDWLRVSNPMTFRSFAQTFAKNLFQNMNQLPGCNGIAYGQDKIETLLDDYGLLLFRSYNQNRNYADPVTRPNTLVMASNRKKSTLISKNLIKLDPTPGASAAFVIDGQDQITNGVASLQSLGIILSNLSQTPAGFPFNNGNGRVSPGEVVAIGLNLYNDSNAIMGGIQVLANDWNHIDPTGRPYIFDQWPLAAEGGTPAPAPSVAAAKVAPFTIPAEELSPVCLIQSKALNGSSTQWMTQKAYRQIVAVDQTMCLDTANDKDCFIRAVKGVEQSTYSKLAPKSNWGQTMMDPQTKAAYSLSWSNVILFQVSKHIPPGTVVNCRLRVRFSNCEDCYHDQTSATPGGPLTRPGYDYKDIYYNDADPFKIVSLQFSVID